MVVAVLGLCTPRLLRNATQDTGAAPEYQPIIIPPVFKDDAQATGQFVLE